MSKHAGLTEDNNSAVNGKPRSEELGDFTTTWRVLPISLLAMAIGVLCAYVALALLRLIGLFTNLFYFGRWSTTNVLKVYPDETLRVLVYQMAESGITRMRVVERGTGKLLGIVTLDHLLKARTRHLEEERRRERILTWRFFSGPRPESVKTDS